MSDTTTRLWSRAKRYLDAGQTGPARATLESVVARDPMDVGAHLILAGLAWADDHPREATRCALVAAQHVGNDPAMIVAVVNALVQVGEACMARQLLGRPVLVDGDLDGSLLVRVADLHQRLEQHADALAYHERARRVGQSGDKFDLLHAIQLAFNGRLEEARTKLEGCAARNAPQGRVYLELARMRRATLAHNHLPQIERQITLVAPDGEDRAALEFARYKELEDLESFDEAWQALMHANALMAARTHTDVARDGRLLDALLKRCSATFLRADPSPSDGLPQPVFIIGIPRSGTTLLDRLLGAHPQTRSVGELRDFGQQMRWMGDHCSLLAPDEIMLERLPSLDFAELGRRYLTQTQWRGLGKRYFIDKLPANWMVAGLIAKALPQAKILHMVRDAMDACFSNFRAFFSDGYPWSYAIDDLAAHHLQYGKAMAHWHTVLPGRILDVSFADLTGDTEATMRRVLAHCELAWDPACLDVSLNATPVATLSFAQARQQIHGDSGGRWRPYATRLEPLREILSR